MTSIPKGANFKADISRSKSLAANFSTLMVAISGTSPDKIKYAISIMKSKIGEDTSILMCAAASMTVKGTITAISALMGKATVPEELMVNGSPNMSWFACVGHTLFALEPAKMADFMNEHRAKYQASIGNASNILSYGMTGAVTAANKEARAKALPKYVPLVKACIDAGIEADLRDAFPSAFAPVAEISVIRKTDEEIAAEYFPKLTGAVAIAEQVARDASAVFGKLSSAASALSMTMGTGANDAENSTISEASAKKTVEAESAATKLKLADGDYRGRATRLKRLIDDYKATGKVGADK